MPLTECTQSGYIPSMAWEIEGTDDFADWFRGLNEAEKEDVIASVDLLEVRSPMLGYPHSSAIVGSRHTHMRELRIQHAGRPYRVLSIRGGPPSFCWVATNGR